MSLPGGFAIRDALEPINPLIIQFQGKIRGIEDSTAAISTCDNAINGVVFDGEETFYLHATSNGSLVVESGEAATADHYLMRLVNFYSLIGPLH